MAQSMTGYGAAEREGFKVEVRSLNHRYIDVSVRTPLALIEHDIPIRNRIKERFSRGKFDVVVSVAEQRQARVSVNKELARGVLASFLDLQQELSLPGTLDIHFFSGYRELLITEEPDYRIDALFAALDAALDRLEEMRRQEGEALAREMTRHVEHLKELRLRVEEQARGRTGQYRDALARKVAELAQNIALDETRLAQEVAFLAQRSDITEELARLQSHFDQFGSILAKGEAAGRKLDFLIQEMNRETNTIASKTDDVAITNIAIEMKTALEKLREQIQNIQ